MTYPTLVSGSLLATRNNLAGFRFLVADQPSWPPKAVSNSDDDLLPYLVDANSLFAKESQKLSNIEVEFTQKDEDMLRFMLKCLIEVRKLFNKNTGKVTKIVVK